MLSSYQIIAGIVVITIGTFLIYRTIKKYGEMHGYLKDDPVFGKSSLRFCGQEFKYSDIASVEVKKDTSKVSLETRLYAGGACSRLNYDKIVLKFKNGKELQIPTTRRKILNKYLKELDKHLNFNLHPEKYNEPFATGYEVIIFLIVLFWILKHYMH